MAGWVNRLAEKNPSVRGGRLAAGPAPQARPAEVEGRPERLRQEEPLESREAAIADNVLTMPELESLGPRKGIATTFHELLDPLGGAAKVPHLKITAQGLLLDGGSFQFHYNDVETNKPRDNVRIEFR